MSGAGQMPNENIEGYPTQQRGGEYRDPNPPTTPGADLGPGLRAGWGAHRLHYRPLSSFRPAAFRAPETPAGRGGLPLW